MTIPETKYALSGDVNIAYQVSGTGPLDIVFAPGTMSHLDLAWEAPGNVRVYEGIGKFARLIRFDKRGTGLSDRPTHMATLEDRTDDIRAVMDAVGIEKAHILGGSEGGSMACLFAATYPERTLSLMVWGGQAKWINTPDHPWGQTQEEHEAMLEMIKRDWPSREYIQGPGAGLGEVDEETMNRILRYMRAGASPSAVYAYEKMNGEIDTRPILPSIQAPALIMNRTGDPVAHVEAARDMASRIPGAIFKEYPGNSHMMAAGDVDVVLADIEEFVTGSRPVPALDRVLATILFLDVVGSTEKATELGDSAWGRVLDDYYRVVRRNLERYRGVEAGTAGDGFLATFDGPARAVFCGLAIAKEVQSLGIQIRAGVHTGECERMGDNVGGIAVHIGARVMAKAAPSEVLVSGTVKDLVAGAGIAFRDGGVHELKGVSGEFRLFAAG